MIQTYELREYPIDDRNDECGVLHVWVDSIRQMGRVAFVANVIDQPECPRDMQPDRVRMRRGKVLEIKDKLRSPAAFLVE